MDWNSSILFNNPVLGGMLLIFFNFFSIPLSHTHPQCIYVSLFWRLSPFAAVALHTLCLEISQSEAIFTQWEAVIVSNQNLCLRETRWNGGEEDPRPACMCSLAVKSATISSIWAFNRQKKMCVRSCNAPRSQCFCTRTDYTQRPLRMSAYLLVNSRLTASRCVPKHEESSD